MINKVMIIGHLGKDPEMKQLNADNAVSKFSVATSESYKDKKGDWVEQTEWHNVECWNQQAVRAADQLKKGSKVYIEGKLKTDKYEKNGVTMFATKVVASTFRLLDKREGSNQPASQEDIENQTDGWDNVSNPKDDLPF